MLFRSFSKRKDTSKLKLNWEGEQIDRVQSYMYLGVPFTEQLNFEFVKDYFKAKSQTALRELESLVFRSKMNNFSSILSLFHSLVRSVFSYCSEIWGVNFADCFERLRLKFLKSLFLLPQTIPAFFLRLELGLKTSEIFFLKLCLKFIAKVTSSDKDSLMYKAYNTMKKSSNFKKCWYNQVQNLCKTWDCEYMLDIANDSKLSAWSKIIKINVNLAKIENDSISKDICNMQKTKLLSLYRSNKTHCISEAYLSEHYNWSIKQLILQLKLGISHITNKGKVARLRSLEYMYGKFEDSKCPLCGRDDEDTYHLLFKCPHYEIERRKYVYPTSSLYPDLNEHNYLQMFNNLDKTKALSLYYFFNCCLTRRRMYIEEMGE